MNLRNYFLEQHGTGILSTADAAGHVDAAIYARPHVLDDGSLAMIMRDRLSRHNLQENPYAAYMFIEDGPGHRGVRLFLRRLREDTDQDKIARMTRRWLTPEEDRAKGPKFITYFAVEKVLPLVGGKELTRGSGVSVRAGGD